MKFNNGFWLTKKGYTMYCPAQAYFAEREGDTLRFLAPTHHISGKGDTLGGPALTFTVSAPMPDVIRVRVSHFEGGPRSRGFELNEDPSARPEISLDDKTAVIQSGALKAVVTRDPWSLDFYEGGERLTGGGPRSTGYFVADDGSCYMRSQFDLDVGECVYGLGERFTEFVKNGQQVDMWNADGGTCSEQAYKNIPFYVTNKGYGIFLNHTKCVSFEVGSEVVSRVGASLEGEELEYCVVGGPTLKDVLAHYTALTGRPALPPAWSFGLWLSTSFTTNYDEKTVTGFVEGMKERDIPLSVFHFDCYWLKEFHLCDFEWDERVFPDPKGMLARLKARGLHICVWLNPYVSQSTKMFREGMENGYFLRKSDGSVWQTDLWEPGMAVVDFTNPAACEWYAGKLNKMLDCGVDCFKTDFGERIPVRGIVYADGSDSADMHNYYTYIYNKTVYETIRARRPDAVIFGRSATAGSQKFPVQWGGDCSATYPSMAETIRGGLSLGMCGFGFWSHDISGFESTATPDLYKRWLAFGLFSSHSRLHGSSSYRVPWNFDEESVSVLRRFVKLKCSLMPYIYAAAVEASRTGVPVLRAMVLEFQHDPACLHLDRQYMFGPSLLVAPILNDRGKSEYYLPAGRWVNSFTGEVVEGGSYRDETYDYMSLPLFQRENSIVAVGNRDDRPDYDYADGVCFRVAPVSDGQTVSACVFDEHGEESLCVTAKRESGEITLRADGAVKPWTAELFGISSAESIEGAAARTAGNRLLLTPEQPGSIVRVRIR